MTQTLREIAQQLSSPKVTHKKITKEIEVSKAVPKVQLIYAFNGTGKTRLSREFKEFIAPKSDYDNDEESSPRDKILYYNAFTEDLFYWHNDLDGDTTRKLNIQPNEFTDWLLSEQGQEPNIRSHFQRYTNDKLTPNFSEDFSEVTFSLDRGDDDRAENIKISKGEESIFIWSVFYALLELVISALNVPEADDRDTEDFNELEYVFIDDPVSSLDENHLIELAVNLAALIKESQSGLKFIISTHNPLFYNVLHNEVNSKSCYLLERFDDGTYALQEKQGDSNTSFSYHLHIKKLIEQAIENQQIEKFHFMLLRNLYEKTASFLGYPKWKELLPDDQEVYFNRVIQFASHKALSNEEIPQPTNPEKQTVALLLNHLKDNYSYWQPELTDAE